MAKTTQRQRVSKDEQGATLILVLIFTLVTSLTIAGLFTALRNDLSNSKNFASARSLQYDATTATDLAIQSIRYTPLLGTGQTLNASPPQPCWAVGGTYGAASTNPTQDGVNIAVWCSTAWFPTSATTRVVTISACQASLTNSACAQNPVLQTVVAFNDYPAGGSEPTDGQCVVYCGAGLAIDSWLQFPTVPTVSGLSSTSGSVSGGGSITITGSSFAQDSTINFIEESGGTPTTNNVVVSVRSSSCSSTSCTATIPAVTSAGDYFVTVTTPEGSSADSQSELYDFQVGTPVITGVSTPSSGSLGGPSTGGTFVTISGSNFIVGDTVNFLQEQSGSNCGTAVSGAQPQGATSVTVSRTGADTVVITALAPNITSVSPDTYFVLVTSPSNVTSANPSNCSNVFTYTAVVPTVNTVSPASGPSSTAITIIGTGFLSGATVSFTPESGGQPNGSPINQTTVSVASSGDELTADAPTLTKGDTYFVTVSNAGVSGSSSEFPVFTAT
ncbi:MAG: IPT/TIG domain-containing protein [Acidimicrobiales bacterium]